MLCSRSLSRRGKCSIAIVTAEVCVARPTLSPAKRSSAQHREPGPRTPQAKRDSDRDQTKQGAHSPQRFGAQGMQAMRRQQNAGESTERVALHLRHHPPHHDAGPEGDDRRKGGNRWNEPRASSRHVTRIPSRILGGSLLHSTEMKLRRPQRSKDVTVSELSCLVLLYTILWPIGICVLIRYRVIQAVIAGYREGSTGQ